MLDYIIQVILFQTLFLAAYDLFLKKETFFQWNRAYLLITSILAYCIPLIKMNSIQQALPQEYVIQLPEIMLSPTAIIKEKFDWSELFFNALPWILWIGVILMTILFVIKLINLLRLIYKNETIRTNKYKLVLLRSNKAFSFFNYIFLKKEINPAQKEHIIEHELVHVTQRHTLDLLFFEVQKIICWFNPFSYLFQNRIAELHEFIADSQTVKTANKKEYFQNLLSQSFGTHKMSFINSFFKISLIKKRILMLNKNKSKEVLKLKYVLLIPVLLSMLLYSSCERQEEVSIQDKSIEELIDELKIKTDEFELSADEINGLLEIMTGSLKNEDLDDAKKKVIKEQLYLYLMKKREEILASYDEQNELQIEDNTSYDTSKGIPFASIAKPPVFPGCEKAEGAKKCFSSKLSQFVAENFDVSISNTLQLKSGKQKIFIQFKIDKEGAIVDVKVRAPHKALVEEAKRMMNLAPIFKPGEKENGEKVAVTYMLPIAFNVQ